MSRVTTGKDKTRGQPFKVLFVCTANICRSPMAEGILKDLVAKNELQSNIEVASAGVAAVDGEEASFLAQQVSRDEGIDMSRHASQPLTGELLRQMDVVLTMTRSQQEEIQRRFPEHAEKIFLLKAYGNENQFNTDLEIEDPYGGTTEGYERCYLRLRREIERIFPLIVDSIRAK